jgi:hypothetical protein
MINFNYFGTIGSGHALRIALVTREIIRKMGGEIPCMGAPG